MKINTKDFGELEIDEKEILHFKNGLFAFEEITNYVLIEQDGFFPKWLQSVSAKEPRFIVCDPADIVGNYQPLIPKEALSELAIGTEDQYRLFVIAVVPNDVKKMTVNFKSPLVVNFKNHLAAQVILDQEDYPIRYRVFKDDDEEGEPAC